MNKARTFNDLRHPDRVVDKEIGRVAAAFAKVAETAEGRVALAWMRRVTIEQAMSPEASDGALRAAEGKRQLVRQIESMIANAGRSTEQS